MVPWRALPVPFWRYGFLPVPRTSDTRSELCVPARALARCHFTASQRRCSFTSAPQIASSRSMSPTVAPLVFLISNFMALASGLDLDVDAGREVELHQRVERLLRRLEDVEEPLVGADLELLARLLVHVRRTQHAVLVDLRRQRDRARDLGVGPLGGVDDLRGRLVEELVIVRLQADANLRCRHALC